MQFTIKRTVMARFVDLDQSILQRIWTSGQKYKFIAFSAVLYLTSLAVLRGAETSTLTICACLYRTRKTGAGATGYATSLPIELTCSTTPPNSAKACLVSLACINSESKWFCLVW